MSAFFDCIKCYSHWFTIIMMYMWVSFYNLGNRYMSRSLLEDYSLWQNRKYAWCKKGSAEAQCNPFSKLGRNSKRGVRESGQTNINQMYNSPKLENHSWLYSTNNSKGNTQDSILLSFVSCLLYVVYYYWMSEKRGVILYKVQNWLPITQLTTRISKKLLR